MRRHEVKAADTAGVKDDPVSGWAIAGGAGVIVTFGLYYGGRALLSLLVRSSKHADHGRG